MIVLVPLKHDRAALIRPAPETWRSWEDGEVLAEGSRESVEAAAKLLYPGQWTIANCISPNGRLDGHMSYVKMAHLPDARKTVCAFCGKNDMPTLMGHVEKKKKGKK